MISDITLGQFLKYVGIIDCGSYAKQFLLDNKVWINGEEVPPIPTKRKNHCITQINDKVYVDGYEFKKGKWRRI